MDLMDIQINNHGFQISSDRVLYWPTHGMLVVSDIHVGKSTHFRKSGIAITPGLGIHELTKLELLLKRFSPDHVVFLGDLFHSDYNLEWNLFMEWRMQHLHIAMSLIAGNHDILHDLHYTHAQLNYVDSIELEGILFTHEPVETKNTYNIYGHVHPGIRLYGKAKQSEKMACFVIGKQRTIMPSFGNLTGVYVIEPETDDTIVGIIPHQLIRIK